MRTTTYKLTTVLAMSALLFLGCPNSSNGILVEDQAGEDGGTIAEVAGHDVAMGDSHVPDDTQGTDIALPEDAVEEKEWLQEDTADDHVPTELVLPFEGCCFVTEDCDAGQVCVGAVLDPWQKAGSCQPAPNEGRCWSDDDCAAIEDWCQNPAICGCEEKCALEPGWCVHTDPPFCCQDDDDCFDGNRCIGGDMGAGGVCLPEPAPEDCYGPADCAPTEYCYGETVCSCDMNCISELGACMPYGPLCCFNDTDCPATEQCVSAGYGEAGPGVCKGQPAQGECWHNLQCKQNEMCEGADICPCDADCDGADKAGLCKPVCGESDCCCSDAECGEGNVCAFVANGNVCLPKQVEGMCWNDWDCGENQYCHGAGPCPCNWDCDGDGWDIPGNCKSTGGDLCCMYESDCPQYYMGEPMVCFFEDGNPDAVGTCQNAAPLGKCWSSNDCYMEQACNGAIFCPCGMDCGYPGTTTGDCSPLPEKCCYSNEDCADGHVCRGIVYGENQPGHCVPDPNGPECMGDAQCCWDNSDCGYGTCKNASLCGCVELCPVCGACAEEQMGFCA